VKIKFTVKPIRYIILFHRRTRSAYVYNGCLAWYNVVLTPRIHSTVKYSQLGKRANVCDVSKQPTGTLCPLKNRSDNKEYNGISTYTPIDCIPRLNDIKTIKIR